MAFVHPVIVLVAMAFGIYAGLLGFKRFQYKRGHASASAFPWQRHIRAGKRFIFLLWIGTIIAVLYTWYRGVATQTGLHATLGILILLLFTSGSVLGLLFAKGKGGRHLPLVHMGINYTTFLLAVVQAALGILLLGLYIR